MAPLKGLLGFLGGAESVFGNGSGGGGGAGGGGPLYSFSTFTFYQGPYPSSEGRYGNPGPTILPRYNTTNDPWLTNPDYWSVPIAGHQLWTVPITGNYTITMTGGSGGGVTAPPGSNLGGRAATMAASFDLTAGDKYYVIVGKRVPRLTNYPSGGGNGGGGGSFVIKYDPTGDAYGRNAIADNLLIAAGGGGGASRHPSRGQNNGGGGRSTTSGGPAIPLLTPYPFDASFKAPGPGGGYAQLGGTNGYGGGGHIAGGGAGYFGTGGTFKGGGGYLNGFYGGDRSAPSTYISPTSNLIYGAFGGGGGGQMATGYGGGGGGYSGGGGGAFLNSKQGAGGGGGSYINPVRTAVVSQSSGGNIPSTSSGIEGYVTITYNPS